jgi:hypothetical protein
MVPIPTRDKKNPTIPQLHLVPPTKPIRSHSLPISNGASTGKPLPSHPLLPPPMLIPTPKIWTSLSAPILASPNATLKLTWHLCNPSPYLWPAPIILSMLICKSSPASAMFDAWTETQLTGDTILQRTKCDLDVHEGRYEYLTEKVGDAVVPGESLEVSAEIVAPEVIGRYWGCFKVVREAENEYYCTFRCATFINHR